ncbi:unnamed protein product [Kuraishia capsulata CBS 1993]|uniref:Glycosyltransferase family 71 protein n=1 Tax=Kuraishia capsulata CBS 1993 TaxID=1382522 RepID=W6MVZ6_9ASCO|nr:uncharacterized protein KUCA_T00002669001 [Kuraishia capsulata CBS 1993]CDK26695.1 unnamed protein product [Kuraishia capsulata CBS 1993]
MLSASLLRYRLRKLWRFRRRSVVLVAAAFVLVSVLATCLPHSKSRSKPSFYDLHRQDLASKRSLGTPNYAHAQDGVRMSLKADSKARIPESRASRKSAEELQRILKLQNFYNKVLDTIYHNKPTLGLEPIAFKETSEQHIPRKFGRSKDVALNVALHDKDPALPTLSEYVLDEVLQLPGAFVNPLAQSHANVVGQLPESLPMESYSGNGVVFIGGAKFSWLSLLSLENMRMTGSQVPVEIMIPTEREYEPQLCEQILPKMNARCVMLTDIIPEFTSSKLSGYQYKSLAILASSFENVLLLDSDNTVVSNPDVLFDSEPFLSKGLVTWPDFWKRVTHPMYYRLAGIKLGKRVRNVLDDVTNPSEYVDESADLTKDVPLHDREGSIPDISTESGQMIINKRTHGKAILLSLYYNVYGPLHYYPLFSQGANGEGDKETFVAAANFFKLPYYQVKKGVDVVGFWKDDPHEYTGVGMIQYNPIVDFENVRNFTKLEELHAKKLGELAKTRLGRLKMWAFGLDKYNPTKFENFFTKGNSQSMFIHSNYPKLDPVALRRENKLFLDQDPSKKRIRTYADQTGLDFDYELRQWTIIKKFWCDVKLELNYLSEGGVKSEQYCDFIMEELNFLESTTAKIKLQPRDK